MRRYHQTSSPALFMPPYAPLLSLMPPADSVLQDLAVVKTWPAVQQPGAATGQPSSLGAAFWRLRREQLERWEVAAQRAAQLEALRAEVAAAREALAPAADPGSDSAAAHTQLAARQAGLRAELQSLDRARQAAEQRGAAAAEEARAVRAEAAAVAELEGQEARLDAAVRALCAADGAAMRAWRQGTWKAQEQVEAVAAQRQVLAQLAQQLLDAQRAELAAFRAAASEAGSKAPGEAPPAASSATREAAQLLEPLAHLKSDEHAATVVAAAADELRQLQSSLQQWEALANASAGRLAGLQSTACELAGRVAALQQDGGADAAMAQLREAAAAAEEAGALVVRTRQALSEWWTSPAVTAAPWVKRECVVGGARNLAAGKQWNSRLHALLVT